MAVVALFWGWFIEEDGLCSNHAHGLVAAFALNILMCAAQRKCGARLVVK